MYIASIDPGLSGTGIALWLSTTWKQKCLPDATKVLKGNAGLDWQAKAEDLTTRVIGFLDCNHVCEVYCEWVITHHNAVGHAASSRGDIFKLAYFIGLLGSHYTSDAFHLITSNEWKGQLTKQVVKNRIVAVYNHKTPMDKIQGALTSKITATSNDHDWDAVGLGLFAKGYF